MQSFIGNTNDLAYIILIFLSLKIFIFSFPPFPPFPFFSSPCRNNRIAFVDYIYNL